MTQNGLPNNKMKVYFFPEYSKSKYYKLFSLFGLDFLCIQIYLTQINFCSLSYYSHILFWSQIHEHFPPNKCLFCSGEKLESILGHVFYVKYSFGWFPGTTVLETCLWKATLVKEFVLKILLIKKKSNGLLSDRK